MKATAMTPILATALAPATALAAAREDGSGFFVWIFLGFCALIVIAQLLPALLIATGLMKAIHDKPVEQKAPAE